MEMDKFYESMLDVALSRHSRSLSDVMDKRMGLLPFIRRIELPYADQNAMADVEGRPRPVVSYGGVSSSRQWWGVENNG